MKTYYGNYLGMVITGGEKDPEGRGRCQIFIPHIMPALYEGWNKEGEDISFDIVGEGLPTALKPEIVETLKKILPWAECAAPMVGASPSTKDGDEIKRNIARAMSQIGGLAPVQNLDLNALGGGGGAITQDHAGKIRSQDLSAELQRVISAGLAGTGLNWNSTSGGQPPAGQGPRTGSTRHDFGNATDGQFVEAETGRVLDANDPKDRETISAALTRLQAAGIKSVGWDSSSTGFGHYMGSDTFHLDIDGRGGVWGHTMTSTSAAPWIKTALAKQNVPPVNHSAINLDVGQNMKSDGESGGTDYDLEQGSLPENIKSKITPESEAALNRVAARYGLDPNAIAMLVNTESGWNTNTTSPGGTYRGATQIGEITFREAGGTLGGLTWSQFLNAPIHRQIDAYGDWLKQYNFSTKIDTAGINLGNLTTAQQSALLQGFQFSPNKINWLNAFAGGNGSIPSTASRQARVLGSTSMDDMSKYYTELYGGSIAQIASTQKIIQNPTEDAASYGPNTNYQAVGMFGYASEGTAVWTFFREGNPLFPVYFAASYGQKEWQNMYQHSSQGIGCGDGGALPGTEKMRFNSYGGGFDSTQVMENPELGLEPGYAFQVFGKNGSNLLFTADHTEFNSVYNHNQRVSGDFHEITEANKEQRVRGDSNSYLEQDVYVTVGNWSDEAIAASDEIQEYLNEAMRIKSGKGSAQQQTTYNPTQSLANVQQAASKAANAVIDTAQRFTSKRT